MFSAHVASRAVAAVAIVTAAALAVPATAIAAPSGPAGAPTQLAAGVHPSFGTPATPSGSGGAGYYIPGVALSTATTTFTVPSISCASDQDDEYLAPGILILNQSGLPLFAGVVSSCTAGAIGTTATICLTAGCDSSLPVNAGDRIRVSVTNATDLVATVSDITTHQSLTDLDTALGTNSLVFFGDVGPQLFGSPVVPTFTTNAFRQTAVNGQNLTAAGAVRVNLSDGVNVQITAGALSPAATAFSTKFRANG